MLLGERARGRVHSEDLVEWAVQELVDGEDGPALRVLAGLSRPFYWSEVDQAFTAVLDEIGIAEPPREECLWRYARLLAQRILQDETAIVPSLGRLKELWEDLDNPGALQGLAYLHYSWWDVERGEETFYYEGATRENFVELARAEAALLLGGYPTVGTCVPAPARSLE